MSNRLAGGSEVCVGEAVEGRIHEMVRIDQAGLIGLDIDQAGDQPVVSLRLFEGVQGFPAVESGCSPYPGSSGSRPNRRAVTSRTSPFFDLFFEDDLVAGGMKEISCRGSS